MLSRKRESSQLMSEREFEEFWQNVDYDRHRGGPAQAKLLRQSYSRREEEEEDDDDEATVIAHPQESGGRTVKAARCGSCDACRAKDCGECTCRGSQKIALHPGGRGAWSACFGPCALRFDRARAAAGVRDSPERLPRCAPGPRESLLSCPALDTRRQELPRQTKIRRAGRQEEGVRQPRMSERRRLASIAAGGVQGSSAVARGSARRVDETPAASSRLAAARRG